MTDRIAGKTINLTDRFFAVDSLPKTANKIGSKLLNLLSLKKREVLLDTLERKMNLFGQTGNFAILLI